MNLTAIGQVRNLPEKTPMQAIEGTITTVYPDISWSGGGNNRTSYQRGKIRGTDGQEIIIKWEGYGQGEDGSPHDGWINNTVRYEASHESHIIVESHNGKNNIKVKRNARETWNPPDFGQHAPAAPPPGRGGPPPRSGPPQNQQGGQPQRQQGPPQGGHTGYREQSPPTQRNEPETEYPKRSAFLGVTVGMAINNACSILSSKGITAEDLKGDRFFKQLRVVASDILRVSQMLEADGGLAKDPLERAKTKPATTGQQQHYEPDPSHQPPPNSAQSGQATSRQRQQHDPAPGGGYPSDDAPEGGRYGGRTALPPAFPDAGQDDVDF